MPIIFNGTTRQIEVTDGSIVSLDVKQDIYSAWKDWSQLSDNSKYAKAMFSFGGNDTATGQTAPEYFFLTNLWQILIDNGNVVSVGLNLYTEDYATPYIVALGSGVSDRNSDAVNVNSKQIEDGAFGDERVWIDVARGQAGTLYPIGTTSTPVNNLTDALTIITERTLPHRIHLEGTINTLLFDLTGYDIKGASSKIAGLNVDIGTNTTNMILEAVSMTGDLNGNITATGSTSFDDIIDFDGKMIHCGLKGNIDLGSSGETHEFIDCFSEEAGNVKPTVDGDNLVNNHIQFRRYSGGLIVTNFVNGGSQMSIGGTDIDIILDSTCTGGTIVVRGIGKLTDNSGAGCTVIKDAFLETQLVTDQSVIAAKNTDSLTG